MDMLTIIKTLNKFRFFRVTGDTHFLFYKCATNAQRTFRTKMSTEEAGAKRKLFLDEQKQHF